MSCTFVAFIVLQKYQLFFNNRWLGSAQLSPILLTPLTVYYLTFSENDILISPIDTEMIVLRVVSIQTDLPQLKVVKEIGDGSVMFGC
jgi:hypothetical protein